MMRVISNRSQVGSLLRLVRKQYPSFSTTSNAYNVPKVCIIGTGPAGFYTAMKLIKVWYALLFYNISIFSWYLINNVSMSSLSFL